MSPTMDHHKPLPAIPTTPGLATLSIDARAHRSHLIRYFLSEVDEPGIHKRHEGWVYALEEALDDFGRYAEKEDWLAGIRRQMAVKVQAKVVHTEESLTPAETRRDSRAQSPVASPQPPPSLVFPSQTSSRPEQILRQLYARISHNHPPASGSQGFHLLVTLAPCGSKVIIPTEDHGFDIIPANINCAFTPGKFFLPATTNHLETAVLYGLKEWDDNNSVRIVGGTFTFKGVESLAQHEALAKILRISIYVHLSLLLEQQFLSNSHAAIKFPRPKVIFPSSSAPSKKDFEIPQSSEGNKEKGRNPFLPPGILSFFSRRKGLSHRAQTINQTGSRGSLDLILNPSELVQEAGRSPRSSIDGGLSRLRRFSIIERRPSLRKAQVHNHDPTEPADGPFVASLKRIESAKNFLSTSFGVMFLPPPLMVDLATKERENPNRRLKGDERVALTSILGWMGKDAAGKGMSGIQGFVCQQEFSFLYSKHVPAARCPDGSSSLPTVANNPPSCIVYPNITTVTCGRPKSITNRYYAHQTTEDRRLGEVIFEYISTANLPCIEPGCLFKRGQHEHRLVHNGLRITIKVTTPSECPELEPDSSIEMWQSCEICNAETPRSIMTDGTYLLSYAKFLELLIYSPTICTLSPILCEHVQSTANSSTSRSHSHIIRHFAAASVTVSYAMSTIEDIFELHVPRLQIHNGERGSRGSCSGEHEIQDNNTSEEDKKLLRREIKRWWECVFDHMSKLEHLLSGSQSPPVMKALPRLPSTDEAYDDLDTPTTPKALSLSDLPPSIPPNTPVSRSTSAQAADDSTATPTLRSYALPKDEKQDLPSIIQSDDKPPSIISQSQNSRLSQDQVELTPEPSILTTSSSSDERDPSELLEALRHTFQLAEHSLYSLLSRTPVSSLNDVRRSFLSVARGAQKRLYAWQKKHLKSHSELLKGMKLEEPEWFGNGCHVVPGSNIIVREDDWGSIIAFTLSSPDYLQELATLSAARSTGTVSHPSTPPSGPTRNLPSGPSSFFIAGKLFGLSQNVQPDPDRDDVVWHEPEAYSAVISRKEHARDPTSILSFREVLRQKSPIDATTGLPSTKHNNNESQANLSLASVYAKPDVGISMQAVGGEVSVGQSMTENVGKMLQELEASEFGKPEFPRSRSGSDLRQVGVEGMDGTGTRAGTTTISVRGSEGGGEKIGEGGPGSIITDRLSATNMVYTHIKRGKASSVLSLNEVHEKGGSLDLKGKEKETRSGSGSGSVNGSAINLVKPPTPPPKELRRKEIKEADVEKNGNPLHSKELPATPGGSTNHHHTATSSFASTLASSINMAMRYVMPSNPEPPPKNVPPPSKKHHNLLLVDSNNIDERPHIKYDWTVGKRMKFSCTVYYARQFDLMRKRCGIDDSFLKSLSRSVNWEATGGKSKSNFWKTTDDRYIVKTLVNAWNVADLQVLIELAPSYLRYIESTANKATVLAKLIGFYTVEVRNLETGAVQSRADLLVMENLFYNRKINKTFDLKGIQGRKVKAKQQAGNGSRTLFDGDWIEGQQRTLMFLKPHSKQVLKEAIRCDAEFLARSNIMDYSLLLGIDEEKKQIACGLVDTIGSYTFAKTLEYKAKQNLQSGKDTTVIPPAEYQERFVNALDDYFVACPDKWSKSLDESMGVNDPFLLPSVL